MLKEENISSFSGLYLPFQKYPENSTICPESSVVFSLFPEFIKGKKAVSHGD